MENSLRYNLAASAIAVMAIMAGCSSNVPDFEELRQSNPEWLIAKEDSLLTEYSRNEVLHNALIGIHLDKADEAYGRGEWDLSKTFYQHALQLDPKNRQGRFGVIMSDGQAYFKKGGPNDLWEAIVKFGEATVVDTSSGLPHYWLARSYEKKDKNDFDLILESYDRSLNKMLPAEIRKEAQSSRDTVANRKKVFEEFWN